MNLIIEHCISEVFERLEHIFIILNAVSEQGRSRILGKESQSLLDDIKLAR